MGRFDFSTQTSELRQASGRFATEPIEQTHAEQEPPITKEVLDVPVIELNDDKAIAETQGSPRVIIFDQDELRASGNLAAEILYEGFCWSICEGSLNNPHLLEHGNEAYLAIELLANTATFRKENLKIHPNKRTGRLVVSTNYPTDQRYHLLPIPALAGFCRIMDVPNDFGYSSTTKADFFWESLFARRLPNEFKEFIVDLTQEEYEIYNYFFSNFWNFAGHTFPHFRQEDLLQLSTKIGFIPTLENMTYSRIYRSPELVLRYAKELWQEGHPNAKKYKYPYTKRYTNVPVTCFMRHTALITTQSEEQPKSFRMKYGKLAECGNKACSKCGLRTKCML